MQERIEETKHQLNVKINNFNHILERELADREIKEIGRLEEELNNLQEEQERNWLSEIERRTI